MLGVPLDPALHGWEEDPEVGFVTHIGQVWRRLVNGREEIGLVVQAKHLNRNGALHGGMLASLFDHAVGSSCFRAMGQEARLATIQIGTHFLHEARLHDFVVCHIEIARITPSLLFLRGECQVDGAPILSGEAIVKRRRRSSSPEPTKET